MGVPEQGGRNLISSDPLPPGTVYSSAVTSDGTVGLYRIEVSALRKAPVMAATLILGDMSIQGNLKGIKSLTEPLQLGMDNGAKRAMIPIENKRNFLEVSADIVEKVDPIFFGDPKQAAMKALGLT